jgi:hypothetical protein
MAIQSEVRSNEPITAMSGDRVDMKFEAVVIPVSRVSIANA